MRELNENNLAIFNYWQLFANLPRDIKTIIQEYTIYDFIAFNYITDLTRPWRSHNVSTKIDSDIITVIKLADNWTTKYKPEHVFIGKSPVMPPTHYGGTYGPNTDGNSILLYMGQNKYLYINDRIYEFTAGLIIKFESPVGNDECSYPWALDNTGRYYLFNESISLPISQKINNPYEYICGKQILAIPTITVNLYHATFHPEYETNAEKAYDGFMRVNAIINVSRNKYIRLSNEHTKLYNIIPINYKIITPA